MQKSATAGAELLKILRGDRFDPVRAAQLVQGCALNTPLLDENGYKTTYLNEAVQENHLEYLNCNSASRIRMRTFVTK